MKVMEVIRSTTASPEAIWALWADVPGRTAWDDGLEWARLDGAFVTGTTGELKLKGQPPRKFKVLDATAHTSHSERYYLPGAGRMDWHHQIDEGQGDTRSVTFTIDLHGPSSLFLSWIMKRLLREEIPRTVEKLLRLAEQGSTS